MTRKQSFGRMARPHIQNDRQTTDMKKLYFLLFAIVAVMTFAACSDSETYADQKKKERSAINSYIAEKGIKVISEDEFWAQDSTTDVSKNEYVLFETTGVYMQIVSKGVGQKLKQGETATVLCRFDEYNLMDNPDTAQLSNNYGTYAYMPEKMTVTNVSGSFTAAFVTGESLLYYAYSSASVPSGWLVPFSYINLSRLTAPECLAKVKLIVPHSQGQSYASSNVYPCFYDITFERGR